MIPNTQNSTQKKKEKRKTLLQATSIKCNININCSNSRPLEPKFRSDSQ